MLLALATCGLLVARRAGRGEVVTVGGTTVGLSPRVGAIHAGPARRQRDCAAKTFENPEGNPVLHGTATYAIYWDPTTTTTATGST